MTYNFKWLKIFLWSNIPIALDAAAWTALTYKILQTKPDFLIIILSFCFTWLFYTLDRTRIHAADYINNPERTQWYAKQTYLKSIMISLSVLLAFVCSIYSSLIVPILICIFPCLFYAKNIKIYGYTFTLKSLLGMKVILVAFLWVVLTVIFPVIASKINLFRPEIINLGLMIGCFVMLQINTNDLRDIEGDTKEGVKSMAVLLGDKKARLFGMCLIGVGMFCGWNFFKPISLLMLSIFLIARTILYRKEADIYWQLPISLQGVLAYFLLNF